MLISQHALFPEVSTQLPRTLEGAPEAMFHFIFQVVPVPKKTWKDALREIKEQSLIKSSICKVQINTEPSEIPEKTFVSISSLYCVFSMLWLEFSGSRTLKHAPT